MKLFIETEHYEKLSCIEEQIDSKDLFTPLCSLTYIELFESVKKAFELGRDVYTNQIALIGDAHLRKLFKFDIMVKDKDKKWIKFEDMSLPAFFEEEVFRKMLHFRNETENKLQDKN